MPDQSPHDAASAGAAARAALASLPPRLALEVGEWQERVRQNGWRLDTEQWLLGLLTLSCLDDGANGRLPAPLSESGKRRP
jgi:hypothetical protein